MTQERIQFFENLLSKPMAEPHRSWIEELLGEVTGRVSTHKAVMVSPDGSETDIGILKPGTTKVNGESVSTEEFARTVNRATQTKRDRRTHIPAGPVGVKSDSVNDA